jgi:hypothetical protein
MSDNNNNNNNTRNRENEDEEESNTGAVAPTLLDSLPVSPTASGSNSSRGKRNDKKEAKTGREAIAVKANIGVPPTAAAAKYNVVQVGFTGDDADDDTTFTSDSGLPGAIRVGVQMAGLFVCIKDK